MRRLGGVRPDAVFAAGAVEDPDGDDVLGLGGLGVARNRGFVGAHLPRVRGAE